MEPVIQGIMLNTDAALRQLSFSDQLIVVEELRKRIDVRMTKRLGDDGRACDGKRRYPTLEDAEGRKHSGRLRHHKNLESYQCLTCDGFHLGNRG